VALHPEDAPRCIEAWKQAAKNQTSFQTEYRLLCAEDQSYRWHMERALPIFDPNCVVVKWFGTCTDIHDFKEAQAQIEELNARLHRNMIETHHRVKNNLQLITAMIDIQLLNEGDVAPVDEFKRIGSHVRTLAAVHDILTQKAREDTAQLVSIQEVLEKLIPVHQQTAPHCHLSAEIQDIQLTGRKGTSLALAINELLSNAIKHGRGKVRIVITATGELATITVLDDGPGFPHDFDPKRAANTGLELIDSLVHWDLRGEVRFENQQRGGGQVTITIPL